MHSKNRESALKKSLQWSRGCWSRNGCGISCVYGGIALTKILNAIVTWDFGKGSVQIWAGRAGFCTPFHGQTVPAVRSPALCKRPLAQWGLGSLSVQQFCVPGGKGLRIPRKEKWLFVSVRVYPQLSLLSVWIKGNGNINLCMIKKK